MVAVVRATLGLADVWISIQEVLEEVVVWAVRSSRHLVHLKRDELELTLAESGHEEPVRCLHELWVVPCRLQQSLLQLWQKV